MAILSVDIPLAEYHAVPIARGKRAVIGATDNSKTISEVVRARASVPETGIAAAYFSFQGLGANLSASSTANISNFPGVAARSTKTEVAQIAGAAQAVRIWAAVTVNVLPTSMGANWWGLRNSTLPEGAFNELVNAATSVDRLQGHFAPLSADSLETFLLLWDSIKDMAAEPVISVTPSGCVVAEWYEDDENSLAILAGEGQDLHYSLFDNGVIVEGSTPRNRLAEFAAQMRGRQQNPFARSDAY